ncbi:cupin domain-containing protein [Stappia indica]|uniref:cupin domain-containing protein n=1 Tax=Stappia indica TaxID=538381 RepID=UPI000834DD08|nr:cupin domain-containing protein [Stappia indica]
MRLNDDLDRPVTVHSAELDWIASPAAGVERKMLYRVGGEIARATSLVRYAPGSAFPAHTHDGGEEILVLEGTFQDEHGDYPAGSYFRNPPGTAHSPASAEGCVIFVRLWQFRGSDTAQIVHRPGEGEAVAPRNGATSARLLFADAAEKVLIEDWPADTGITIDNRQGLEVLVISGSLLIDGERLATGGWCRLPAGMDLAATSGADGARLWLKEAPLQHADVLTMPE